MTATNHALTGVAIALIVKQPALAIPLAFLSHYVTDAIPHSYPTGISEKNAKLHANVDSLIAIGLTIGFALLATGVSFWTITLSALAAVGPDLVWVWRYYRLGSIKKALSPPMSRLSQFHDKIQWSETRKGYIVEYVWLLAMMYLIGRYL